MKKVTTGEMLANKCIYLRPDSPLYCDGKHHRIKGDYMMIGCLFTCAGGPEKDERYDWIECPVCPWAGYREVFNSTHKLH